MLESERPREIVWISLCTERSVSHLQERSHTKNDNKIQMFVCLAGEDQDVPAASAATDHVRVRRMPLLQEGAHTHVAKACARL